MMIAAFTQYEVLQAFMKYTDTRILTLKLLYSIPGFQDAELATKNYCYDIVKAKIQSIPVYEEINR